MKLGDKIIWAHDLDVPVIQEGVVTKLGKDHGEAMCWVDDKHKQEECLYQMYAWPAAVKEELLGILATRAKLKKDFNDSMGLIYELRNAIARGER